MLNIEKFCQLRPTLYHLAAEGAWPTIQQHGLLSSKEILSKFSVDQQFMREIETHRLQRSYLLQSDEHGCFTLRDRTTLTHAELTIALDGSCTSHEWIDLLSQRVFFFAKKSFLESLISAPLNRKLSHVPLEIETRKLFDAYPSSIEVADINTGYTKRKPARRGPQTFQSPATYSRTGGAHIIEVTVQRNISNILPLLKRAILRKPCGTEELLYST